MKSMITIRERIETWLLKLAAQYVIYSIVSKQLEHYGYKVYKIQLQHVKSMEWSPQFLLLFPKTCYLATDCS
jgi:hypothetical protein